MRYNSFIVINISGWFSCGQRGAEKLRERSNKLGGGSNKMHERSNKMVNVRINAWTAEKSAVKDEKLRERPKKSALAENNGEVF